MSVTNGEGGMVYPDNCLLHNALSLGVDARIQFQDEAIRILDSSQVPDSERYGSRGVRTEHACIESGCALAGLVLREELGSDKFHSLYSDYINFGVDPCRAEDQS
jgi:hypothetical protein